MGNEMGNQNVTGVVKEEDTNTENTKVSLREDVGRADITGESKIILPEDAKKELNENIKDTDSDSPLQGGDPYADKETSGEKEREQSKVQPARVVVYEKDCVDSLPETASLVKDDASDDVMPIDSIPENGPLEIDDHSVDTQTSYEQVEKYIKTAVGQTSEDGGIQSQLELDDSRDNEELMDAIVESSNGQDQQQQPGATETAAACLESIGLSFVHQDLADARNSLKVEGNNSSQQQGYEGKLEVKLTLDSDEESKLMEREIEEILAEMVLTEVKAEYSKVDDLAVNKLRFPGELLLDMNIDEDSLGTEEGDHNMVTNGTTTFVPADLLGEAANDENMLIEMHMDEKDPLLMPEEAILLADSMKFVEKAMIQEATLPKSEPGGKEISPSSLMFCDESLLLRTELLESGTEAADGSSKLSESNQNRKMEPEIFMIRINPENVQIKMGKNGHEFYGCSSESNSVYSEKSVEFEEIASKVELVLKDNNFEEEDFIKKEINVGTEEDRYGTKNKTEVVENRNLYASESISNGLRQEGISTTSEVLPQNQREKCHQTESISEGCKAPETGGSESDHGSKKLVTKLQKSPSFNFGPSTEKRTEECDQTPLLYNEKSVTVSFSSKSDVKNVNTLIHKTEYVEDPPRCQPMLVDEKQVKCNNSHVDSSRKPFLNLMKEEDEAAITVKPQKDALVSTRKNDKRKSRPSLFGTCICCAAMSVMH